MKRKGTGKAYGKALSKMKGRKDLQNPFSNLLKLGVTK